MKRYLLLTLAICCTVIAGHARDTWTLAGKTYEVDTLVAGHKVGPGTTFAKYDLPAMPLKVSVLEIDLTNPHAVLETRLGENRIVGCETPVEMATNCTRPGHEVFAAFNGDFYLMGPRDVRGMPLNGQLRDGEVVVNPVGSVGFALDSKNRPYIDRINFDGEVRHGYETFRVHSVNMLRVPYETTDGNQTFLFTNSYGDSTYECTNGTLVLLEPKDGGKFKWRHNTTEQCVVRRVTTAMGKVVIPDGCAYLWMQGGDMSHAAAMSPGDEVSISLKVFLSNHPEDNIDLKETVGGSTIIMRNGLPEQKWEVRHPRTCVGFNADSTRLYVVIIDGRSKESVGVTMTEACGIFTALGAPNAVNLDGGGSTCMVVNDEVVNAPSGKQLRPVGNGCIVYSNAPADNDISAIAIAPAATTVKAGSAIDLKVWGFNRYDVVQTRDLKDCKFKCDKQLGHITNDGHFVAADKPGTGTVTVKYKKLKTTLRLTVTN